VTDSNSMLQSEVRAYVMQLLRFAHTKFPGKVVIAGLRPLVSHISRAPKPNATYSGGEKVVEKRGPGFLTIKLSDEALVDLKPEHEGKDMWFLVRIDREVAEEMRLRAESRIIRPGEVVS
jgi:hypothetical protein